ncbi:DUF2189 domain-containing protein [Planctobacterium marinum]|uniref:hypothetical protein n=1 Tax=Planctobacterium marinum TaxID=1631968 RepID=UPI001E4069EF|nr:hypothetical protein [Planctobacterium marinum]MCC2603990.1 hypothetical protein [Planctobacterium marinum]
MSENQFKKPQGKLQSALNGDYHFDLKQVLRSGWELTQIDKASMVQGVIIMIVVALMVMSAGRYISDLKGIDPNDPGFRLGLDLLMVILITPLAAGLMMMGINASVGGKNKLSNLFEFVNRSLTITVTAVMTAALVQIGLLLLIVPGLYLMVATGFAIPLVLEKKMLPARAIFTSIKVVNHQWLSFVKLYGVFAALFVLVIITFGIAIIWVSPFYYNVKGILYRDIFGVENQQAGETVKEFEVTSSPANVAAQREVRSDSRTGRDEHFDA